MTAHQPRKRFGQHFLHDPNTILRIIEAIRPMPGQRLVEVGPGLGALTRPLLETCGRLDVIELDRDVIPRLKEYCASAGELAVHDGDVLRFDFRALAGTGKLRVVGNLPYNISTPLLFHLLDQADAIQDMHFMLQKEVVERMAAGAGSRAYGRLSVMLATRCDVRPLFNISRGVFRPPPKVESAFVQLQPWDTPPFEVGDTECFARIVNQAFSMRRKTLRNALRGWLDAAAIEREGIDPGARPETLTPAQFARLSRAAST